MGAIKFQKNEEGEILKRRLLKNLQNCTADKMPFFIGSGSLIFMKDPTPTMSVVIEWIYPGILFFKKERHLCFLFKIRIFFLI